MDKGPQALLRVSLKDIPREGLQMDCDVNPQGLELPPEEGRVAGVFHWEGEVLKTPEGAFVSGTLSGVIIRECVRCLQEFSDQLEVPCTAVFQTSPGPTGQKISEDKQSHIGDSIQDLPEEIYPVAENQIDLGRMLREQVILTTPIQPLCRVNCLGLCQTCGHNLNQGPCQCTERNQLPHNGTIRFRAGKVKNY